MADVIIILIVITIVSMLCVLMFLNTAIGRFCIAFSLLVTAINYAVGRYYMIQLEMDALHSIQEELWMLGINWMANFQLGALLGTIFIFEEESTEELLSSEKVSRFRYSPRDIFLIVGMLITLVNQFMIAQEVRNLLKLLTDAMRFLNFVKEIIEKF